MNGGSDRNLCWPQAQTDPLELCHGLPCSPTHLSHLARSYSEIQQHQPLYTSGVWLSRGSLLGFSIPCLCQLRARAHTALQRPREMPLCQLQKMLSPSYRAPLRQIPRRWHSSAPGAKPPSHVHEALLQRHFPCLGLSWRSRRSPLPDSTHPCRDPLEPSSRLPFAPAIRAPASPLRACANTEAHLNKLRRHNKSKGNEGLCLGAGESLEFNYIGKPLAAKAQQVPDVSSTDVQECAELGGRAGSTTLVPVPSTAPAQHWFQ